MTCLGVLDRGERDKDNATGLKEEGGIEMSTTVLHGLKEGGEIEMSTTVLSIYAMHALLRSLSLKNTYRLQSTVPNNSTMCFYIRT